MTPNGSPSTGLRVSIVIVNYNGRSFIRDCLHSVREFSPETTEVIVVDNDSRDGSAEIIRTEFPWVRLIESATNLGFTGGNNLGAASASGDLLLLLNNDTVLRTPIAPALEVFREGSDIGVVGCRLIYADGSQQESIGRELTPLVLVLGWTPLSRFAAFRRTVHRDARVYGDQDVECAWVSGAFLVTRTELWRDLGGLDTAYFMYMEDVDYCRRIRRRGFRVIYSACCTITHLEGAGRAWIGERALLNSVDSYLVYCRKFYGRLSQIGLAVTLSIVFLARAALYGLSHALGRDVVLNEKRLGFFRAATRLLKSVRPS